MPEYPKRESHFAHKAVRKMMKSCAAQEMGSLAAYLVTVIAHVEDAKRYTGPVTYYNDQLMAVLGIKKWNTFDRARQRAVDAGWLHYEAGGRHRVGKYWVLVPDDVKTLDDSPIDETPDILDTPKTDTKKPAKGDLDTPSSVIRRGQHGGTINPYPSPTESDQRRARGKRPPRATDPVDQKDELPPAGGGKGRTRACRDAAPELATIRRRADELFRRMNFRGARAGKDARLVWQVAALVERGKLPEGAAVDAAAGVGAVDPYPNNPVGYFRACLASADGVGNLTALLRSVRLPAGYATVPEENGQVRDAVAQAAAATELEESPRE